MNHVSLEAGLNTEAAVHEGRTGEAEEGLMEMGAVSETKGGVAGVFNDSGNSGYLWH